MNVRIREAQVRDAAGISELILGLADLFLGSPDRSEAQEFLDSLAPEPMAARIRSSEYHYHVAEHRHDICGVVAIRGGSHIYHLFVEERLHRAGIARILWETARDASGAGTFTVNSSLMAVPVYERFGFKAVKPAQEEQGLVFVPMVFRSRPSD